MFDGFVEEVGCASAISMYHGHLRLTIAAEVIPPKLEKNSPISVNGMLLRIVEVDPESFSVELPCETWLRTSFSRIREGSLLNLERPHEVVLEGKQAMFRGRIDGVGNFQRLQADPASGATWLYMMVRRSICGELKAGEVLGVEGISFTVDQVKEDQLRLVSAHPLEDTGLAHLSINDTLNIECIRLWLARRERKQTIAKTNQEHDTDARGCIQA